MEVGDEAVDFTGLDEELKRSGDSSASSREARKVTNRNDFFLVTRSSRTTEDPRQGLVIGVPSQLRPTSAVSGTVNDGVVLLFIPPWILFLTGEGCAHFCHFASVPAAPARVHGAPVQPRTSAGWGEKQAPERSASNLSTFSPKKHA